jgi:DNA-binding response OmpR family regulator
MAKPKVPGRRSGRFFKKWDLLLLDIDEPGCGGLDMLKEARQRLPVVILSRLPEDKIAARAFRLGASGYIQKEK